jgi:hypothetical protein
MDTSPKLPVGESLSEVFGLYKQHFGVLIPAAFWLFLPVSILAGIAGNKNVGLLGLAAILTFAVAMLYQGMVVSLVHDVQDGSRDSSVSELISSVGPVLPTLLVTSIIYGVAVGVGFFLLVVPGCILLTIWAVIAPAIVIEKKGIGGAFSRSQALVRGNGWPVFGTVIAATLIAGIATLFLTAIAEGIAGGPILRIVFGTLATTLTAPIGGLVAAVLYYRLVAIKGDAQLRDDPDPMMPPPLDPTDPPAGPIG